jgi:hypothetical protein
MPDSVTVATFRDLLQHFAPCFTAPSFQSFVLLLSGWTLNLRRHTVTETIRAAAAVDSKHVSSFHRFFSRGRWLPDQVGLVLVRLIDRFLLPDDAVVLVPLDDTLGRHTGKRIAAAGMHRDPLLSTAARPFFHWGHVWVVLSLRVDAFGKGWALPVLFRLYRTRKRCETENLRHTKLTALAAQLVKLASDALPHRRLCIIVDAAYMTGAVVRGRPRNVDLVGRSRLDAALYAPPPKRRHGQMGRPRVRGRKLPSPAKLAARLDVGWRRMQVTVYGKTVLVRVLLINALWYKVARSELVRLVVVRGFPGHDDDDVFACTDATLDPATIIERFAARWSLEVTFHDTKGKLGFEHPQNRTEHAVERTAPMALWAYSLTVLWYVRTGHNTAAAKLPTLPWYHKNAPTFTDMLATLRRASWLSRLSVPCANVSTMRKRIRPILEYVAA